MAMVIDFHTHILPPSFHRRRAALAERDATFGALFGDREVPMATAEELVQAMEADEVEMSVAVGYGWCDQGMARESNDYLLEAGQRYPERIIPFCSVNPAWGDAALAEVERCVAQGARGIGELHHTSQGLDLATASCLDPFMDMARRHRLPVLVHSSEPVGHTYPGKGSTTPSVLMAFISRYPDATIVGAHWGGGLPFYGLMPEVKEALANTYFDSATTPILCDQAVYSIAVQALGVEQVLFGSDYPLVGAGRAAQQARAGLKGLDPALTQAVLHDNAARLLGHTRQQGDRARGHDHPA